MPSFRGFSSEAVEFLRELEENNDRDWFKANRARYEEHLRAPAAALGEDLAALGRPRLFRPWNDTRFHPGPPIKEHVGLAIGHTNLARVSASAQSSKRPRLSCAGCESTSAPPSAPRREPAETSPSAASVVAEACYGRATGGEVVREVLCLCWR